MNNRDQFFKAFKDLIKIFSDILTPSDRILLMRTILEIQKGKTVSNKELYDLDELRLKVSLVEYVGQFLKLKKVGKSYVGLCPFHIENTPSFHIYDGSNRYICFGCNRQGSIFDLIMERKGVPFREAVEEIAGHSQGPQDVA